MKNLIKRIPNFLLLQAIFWLFFCASPSMAQVITASARTTITVIPPAGIGFGSANSLEKNSRLDQYNDYEMTLRTSSNVAVVVDSLADRILLNFKHIGQGTMKTFTSRNLSGVSKVEVIFLGN